MKHLTMKHPMIACLAVVVTSLIVQGAEPKTEPNPDMSAAEKSSPAGRWRSEPPADCPFQPSASLTGVEFTGRHAEYTTADTWYPSWASDGNLYSPWTDGEVNGLVLHFISSLTYFRPPELPQAGLVNRAAGGVCLGHHV